MTELHRPETLDFDNTDPALIEHLYDTLIELPEKCPVAWSEASGGFWALNNYADVAAAAQDWQTFTSAEGIMIPATGASMRVLPAEVDPPRHQKVRKLVLPNFTDRALEQWRPGIAKFIEDSFRPILARGHGDIMVEVARPVPVLVICLILGIDRDWQYIRELAECFVDATGRPEEGRAAARDLEAFLQEEIQLRRGKPVTDLLGSFVNAKIDGERFTSAEMLGLVQLLVVAGHETTINGMGSMIWRLMNEPGVRERLLADRSLIAKVIDESLRMHPPVWNLARTVTTDTTLRGSHLCPGEKVMLNYASANRDPEKFENPNVFDIDRPGLSQHLTFGIGRHRCIGELLARLELRLALEFVFDHMPDIEPAGEPVWGGGTNQYGLRSLPVRFTPSSG
jgi:cytochrome P450